MSLPLFLAAGDTLTLDLLQSLFPENHEQVTNPRPSKIEVTKGGEVSVSPSHFSWALQTDFSLRSVSAVCFLEMDSQQVYADVDKRTTSNGLLPSCVRKKIPSTVTKIFPFLANAMILK